MTDINAFAEVAKSGDLVADLSTPRPVIDEGRLAANIARVQAYMDAHSLNFRPHIKTHKIPALATAQLAAGAKGINCQKITEAEVFADCASWIDRVDAMTVECHSDVILTETLLTAISESGGRFDVRHLESNPHLGFDIVTLERSAALTA